MWFVKRREPMLKSFVFLDQVPRKVTAIDRHFPIFYHPRFGCSLLRCLMDGAVEIFMPRFMPGPIPATLLLYRMIQEMEAEREREDAECAKQKLLKKIKGRLPTLPIDLNFRGKSRATGTLLRMISMLDAWLDPPYLQD